MIGPRTIEALKSEVAHAYFARSKPRIVKLHEMLGRLGYKIDKSETNGRLFGATTEEAVKDFQNRNNLDLRGRMNEEVFERLEIAALDARFRTKTQIAGLHRKLMRAIRIAKLGIKIDPQEVKARNFGDSTSEAIREFQKKYRLEATGKLDPVTFERLTSGVASRPSKVSMLKVRSAHDLTEIPRPLRLNMSNKAVGELQKSLSFLGYKVAKKEFDTRTFGKTTREAVIAFQRARGLEVIVSNVAMS